MRVLVTGAAGFVAPYVVEALRSVCGPGLELILTARRAGDTIEPLDVTNRSAVNDIIARFRPTHVVHLAGIAAPSAAASAPDVAWHVHLQGTLNIAYAILTNAPNCWLINAGTGLIYGENAKASLPLNEAALPAPLDEYGATKAAADLALGALSHRGLKCIRMRPFNHIGPGQSEHFVVPALAAQVARIEAGLSEPVIRVGNLNAERDFLDVRDVATAYALAVQKSDRITPGTILNIASGQARSISSVLDLLLSLSAAEIRVEQDPSRMRPNDLPHIVGDARRVRELLGWSPKRPFEQTIFDILADCRKRLAR